VVLTTQTTNSFQFFVLAAKIFSVATPAEAFLTSAQEKKKLQFPIRSGKVGGELLAAIGNYSRSGRTSGYSLISKIVC